MSKQHLIAAYCALWVFYINLQTLLILGFDTLVRIMNVLTHGLEIYFYLGVAVHLAISSSRLCWYAARWVLMTPLNFTLVILENSGIRGLVIDLTRGRWFIPSYSEAWIELSVRKLPAVFVQFSVFLLFLLGAASLPLESPAAELVHRILGYALIPIVGACVLGIWLGIFQIADQSYHWTDFLCRVVCCVIPPSEKGYLENELILSHPYVHDEEGSQSSTQACHYIWTAIYNIPYCWWRWVTPSAWNRAQHGGSIPVNPISMALASKTPKTMLKKVRRIHYLSPKKAKRLDFAWQAMVVLIVFTSLAWYYFNAEALAEFLSKRSYGYYWMAAPFIGLVIVVTVLNQNNVRWRLVELLFSNLLVVDSSRNRIDGLTAEDGIPILDREAVVYRLDPHSKALDELEANERRAQDYNTKYRRDDGIVKALQLDYYQNAFVLTEESGSGTSRPLVEIWDWREGERHTAQRVLAAIHAAQSWAKSSAFDEHIN